MRKTSFFVFFLVVGMLFPLYAVKKSRLPVVAVLSPEIQGDPSIGETLAAAFLDNVVLSLGLTGRYILADSGDLLDYDDTDFRALSRKAKLDSVVATRIEVRPSGRVRVFVTVYNRQQDRIVLEEVRETGTYREIFDAADDLTLSLLTVFSGTLPAFGTLRLKREGIPRDYYVEIDGRFAGLSPSEITWIPAGTYRVRVYEKIGRHFYDAALETVSIPGNGVAEISFSLASQEEFAQKVSERFVTITEPEIPFQVDLGRVTAEELHAVYSRGIAEGKILYRRGQFFLARTGSDGQPTEGKLLADFRTGILSRMLGGGSRSRFIVDREGFTVRPGKEADPVSRLTWYGAVVYCHLLSVYEGLDSCYDVDTWSCDFSRSGYRLPTEKEWMQLDALARKRIKGTGLYQAGSPGSGEWCWDWYSALYLTGIRPPFRAGPRSGSDALIRISNLRRKRVSPGLTSTAGLRTVRTLTSTDDRKLLRQRKRDPQTGLEPWVLGFFQLYPDGEKDDIHTFGGGVTFRWNFLSTLGTAGGAGFLLTDEPDLPAMGVLHVAPLYFGNFNTFAIGLDTFLFVLDAENSETEIGKFTLALSVTYENITVRFFFFPIRGDFSIFDTPDIHYYTFGGGYTFGLK